MQESNKNAKSDSKLSESNETNKATSNVSANITSTNKESIDRLHESKPAPNLSVNATIYEKIEDEPSSQTFSSIPSIFKSQESSKIETVFKKPSNVNEQESKESSLLTETNNKDKKSKLSEMSNLKDSSEQNNDAWKDSGSHGRLNKQRDLASSIFPAGCMGCKDNLPEGNTPRRFIDAKEAIQDHAGHIDAVPRKRPSSAKLQSGRNPLTGVGIEDDCRKVNNRKKGNVS